VLAEYIDKAMEQAVYDIIEDGRTYWGEIPGLQGVWAHQPTPEACRRELREALSDWIALRLRLGLSIPPCGAAEQDDLLLSVAGALSGQMPSAQEIEDELYGGGAT